MTEQIEAPIKNNLELWDKVRKPPLTALKPIQAGRLKGKSDINPTWRIQAMTEIFGPCGIGWKFEVTNKWTVPGPGEQVFAFADVNLYIKVDGVWSEAIPGNGGHKLVEKESAGLHANDEAYKMAITDALSTSMKMLGVAAEVYLGNFDGSKYKDVKEEVRTTPTSAKTSALPPTPPSQVNPDDIPEPENLSNSTEKLPEPEPKINTTHKRVLTGLMKKEGIIAAADQIALFEFGMAGFDSAKQAGAFISQFKETLACWMKSKDQN